MSKGIAIGLMVGALVIGLVGGDVYAKRGVSAASQTAGANFAASAGAGSGRGAGLGGGRGGAGAGGGRFGGGGFVGGQVIAKDATSITVKLMNFASSTANTQTGSKIIFVSPTTQVVKTVEGSLGDVSVGANISVIGTANSDGSVSAQSIQLRQANQIGR